MKLLLALAAAAACTAGFGADARKPFICYWESWSRYRAAPFTGSVSNIPTDLCTHVIYSFVGMDWSTWKLKSLEPEFDLNQGGLGQLVALKKKNPALKVSVAVGGWGEGVQKYSDMAADAGRRKIFVQSVVEFVNKHGFDGFDVDWEYPGDTSRNGSPADKANLILLLKELRAALGSSKLLTIATFSTTEKIAVGYDVPNINKYCDFIHIMAYNLRAAWDSQLGNHVALYSAKSDQGMFAQLNVAQGMRNWAQAGASKSKLIMGIGFYGKSFTFSGSSKPGSASSGDGNADLISQQAGTLFYSEICQNLKKGWTRVFDSETKTPYAFSGNQWVGYEDVEGIRYKTDFINKEGYGGAMTWAIGLDDLANVCGGGAYPLANAVVKGLGGSSSDGGDNHTPEPVPKPTTTTYRPQPQPSPAVDCSSGQEYIPHSSRCSKYFRCVNGTPFEQVCPGGLVFDNANKICNWPGSVSPKLPAGCPDSQG